MREFLQRPRKPLAAVPAEFRILTPSPIFSGFDMAAAKLSAKKCVPCTGKTPPLGAAEAKELHAQVPEWELAAGKKLVRKWRVADFAEGLDFFRRVGDVAEAEDHHPDLHLENYREVRIELWTHAVGGLTENDFIVAAKIDALEPPKLKPA